MFYTTISLEPQPGSLVADAFEAEAGTGVHESLSAFVAYCMNNGDASARMPRCLRSYKPSSPELIALAGIRRTVGVGPKTEIDEDPCSFYGNIERIESALSEGIQPAPFITTRRNDGWHYLLDGNHTKVALQRHGINKWWTIVLEPTVSTELVS